MKNLSFKIFVLLLSLYSNMYAALTDQELLEKYSPILYLSDGDYTPRAIDEFISHSVLVRKSDNKVVGYGVNALNTVVDSPLVFDATKVDISADRLQGLDINSSLDFLDNGNETYYLDFLNRNDGGKDFNYDIVPTEVNSGTGTTVDEGYTVYDNPMKSFAPYNINQKADPTVYGHVLKRNGKIYLQYYFFYFINQWNGDNGGPINGLMGYHEGDWEFMTVELEDENTPLRVSSSVHVPGSKTNITSQNGGMTLPIYSYYTKENPTFKNHPIAYAGKGGHPTYLWPGQTKYVYNAVIPGGTDYHAGQDRAYVIDKKLAVLPLDKEVSYKIVDIMKDTPTYNWLSANIVWGHVDPEIPILLGYELIEPSVKSPLATSLYNANNDKGPDGRWINTDTWMDNREKPLGSSTAEWIEYTDDNFDKTIPLISKALTGIIYKNLFKTVAEGAIREYLKANSLVIYNLVVKNFIINWSQYKNIKGFITVNPLTGVKRVSLNMLYGIIAHLVGDITKDYVLNHALNTTNLIGVDTSILQAAMAEFAVNYSTVGVAAMSGGLPAAVSQATVITIEQTITFVRTAFELVKATDAAMESAWVGAITQSANYERERYFRANTVESKAASMKQLIEYLKQAGFSDESINGYIDIALEQDAIKELRLEAMIAKGMQDEYIVKWMRSRFNLEYGFKLATEIGFQPYIDKYKDIVDYEPEIQPIDLTSEPIQSTEPLPSTLTIYMPDSASLSGKTITASQNDKITLSFDKNYANLTEYLNARDLDEAYKVYYKTDATSSYVEATFDKSNYALKFSSPITGNYEITNIEYPTGNSNDPYLPISIPDTLTKASSTLLATYNSTTNSSNVNLNSGLVAHYEFEGNANDSSGNGNNGTEHGGVTYVDGVIGKAGSFDGIDDYISVNDSASISPIKAMTLSVWVKPDSLSNPARIISKCADIDNCGQNSYIVALVNDDNSLYEQMLNTPLTSSAQANIGNWVLITTTFDGTKMNIFKNGVLIDTKQLFGTIFDSDTPLTIAINGYLSEKFSGLIDDLRIYNRALNDSEIQELYKLGQTNSPVISKHFIKIDKDGKTLSDTSSQWSYIYDKKTNLLWENKVDKDDIASFDSSVPDYTNLEVTHDYDNKYAINDLIVFIQKMEQNNYLGINDWKLPSTQDFTNLINDSEFNSNYFPNFEGLFYTSTVVKNGPSTTTLEKIWLESAATSTGMPSYKYYALFATDKFVLQQDAQQGTVDLNSGLVAHYEFEDNANDSSGNGNNGTEHGGVTYVDGVIGKAGSFDGIDDYIKIDKNFNNQQYSLSIWVLDKSSTNDNYIFCNGDPSASAYAGYALEGNRFWHIDLNNQLNILKVIPTNKWINLTFTFDGSTLTVYKNGLPTSTKSISGIDFSLNQFSYSTIGINTNGVNTNVYNFYGLIDDLRIYNRALNDSEIQALYKLGGGVVNTTPTTPQTINIPFVNETYQDNTVVKDTFTKTWTFAKDVSAYSVKVVSNSYGDTLDTSDFYIDGDSVSVDLTPDSSTTQNYLEVKFVDANGSTVLASGSPIFWSKTVTNTPPTLDENQQYQIAGSQINTLKLQLLPIDKDEDNVTLSIKSSDGESATIDNNELVLVSNDSSKIIHKVVVTLSDGKESVDKEFTVLRFDSSNIASLYSDVNASTPYNYYIAYATLKGAVIGQEDPNDSSKRIFRPDDNVSWAEALAMVIQSSSIAKQIELPNYDYVLQTYPQWAAKYYTFARENSAVDIQKDDLTKADIKREDIARLMAKTMHLEERMNNFPSLAVTFDDATDFSSDTLLYYAKLLKVYGVFMTGANANPQGNITRGELTKVISKIFMMPKAELNIPTSVEYGEPLTIGELLNKEAYNVGNYTELNSSDEITAQYAVNLKVYDANSSIDTAKLNIGANQIIAMLTNHGVREFLLDSVEVTFTDSDYDGVQDSQDKWVDDARYSTDTNANGIPDILDVIYDLNNSTSTGTATINGVDINVSDIITNGGYSAPNTVTKTISLHVGWNLISANITNVANISTKSKILWKYNNGTWGVYSNNADVKSAIANSGLSTFASLANTEGFWIYASEVFDLQVSDNDTLNGGSYANGWHLIGTGTDTPLSSFTCNTGSVNSAWKYSNNNWELNTSIANDSGYPSFDTIKANEGFWLDCVDNSLITGTDNN